LDDVDSLSGLSDSIVTPNDSVNSPAKAPGFLLTATGPSHVKGSLTGAPPKGRASSGACGYTARFADEQQSATYRSATMMTFRQRLNWWRFRFRVWRDDAAAKFGALVRRKVLCDDCGHFFDPADGRSRVFKPSELFPNPSRVCPACWLMSCGSAEAWAVHNNCQGVFTCGVATTSAEAEALLQQYPSGCTVVPVRVIAEPEDRFDIRKWSEKERNG